VRRSADQDALERMFRTNRGVQHVLGETKIATLDRQREAAPRGIVERRHHRRRLEAHQVVAVEDEAFRQPRLGILDMDRGESHGMEQPRGHGWTTSP
jgi:hypothetical protein